MDDPELTPGAAEARTPRPRKASEDSPDYTVASVDRALELLEQLEQLGPSSLARIAGALGCTRTAAFRLLRTMAARNFVLQDGPRGIWRLGPRLAGMKEIALDQGSTAIVAGPVLDDLARATGEVIYLFRRVHLQSDVLAVHQGNPALRRYAEPGSRAHLHAGAGRLLLAYAPEAVQTQVLSQRLPRFTPATITDPRRIAAELVRTRARGWLITESEVEPGAVSISAPVRDAAGEVIGSVSLAGPSFRLRAPRPRALLDAVIAAAERISADLGFRPPRPRPRG